MTEVDLVSGEAGLGMGTAGRECAGEQETDAAVGRAG